VGDEQCRLAELSRPLDGAGRAMQVDEDDEEDNDRSHASFVGDDLQAISSMHLLMPDASHELRHRAPNVGFEVPLEMLSACRHHVESQCSTLQRLVGQVATHGSDAQAGVTAATNRSIFFPP